eukprot:TRINITY_DN3777_c0_g1_i6.p3 TRINITY_DN3777_c0_g1~~TRINITY_DN3777_c0_g1_i6.p3  ORF type:complete len:156 (+),score=4.41 TRINITY_DN3777_c0_g1_i6:1078-1545(+)
MEVIVEREKLFCIKLYIFWLPLLLLFIFLHLVNIGVWYYRCFARPARIWWFDYCVRENTNEPKIDAQDQSNVNNNNCSNNYYHYYYQHVTCSRVQIQQLKLTEQKNILLVEIKQTNYKKKNHFLVGRNFLTFKLDFAYESYPKIKYQVIFYDFSL